MIKKSDDTRKRIICVVGMHRGGTSVATRGLKVLGVDLGDCLMPPAPDNNVKGFWEDSDFNRLNIEMLHHLGHDWHTLYPVDEEEDKLELWNIFSEKARDLIKLRLKNRVLFGLKDPRILRLLPFWNTVFIESGIKPSYVFVVRNPVSVVESLKKRDGFSTSKSTYLWLMHIIPCLAFLQSKSRVFIEYERMINDPEGQLVRIGNKLSLGAPDPLGLSDFISNFLDAKLQHHSFSSQDISTLPCSVKLVESTYQLILKLARDEWNPDTKMVGQRISKLSVKLEALSAKLQREARKESQSVIFDLMNKYSKTESQLNSSAQQMKLIESEKDLLNEELASLTENVKTSELKAFHLVGTISIRDDRISGLMDDLENSQQELLKENAEIRRMEKALNDRNYRINKLLGDLKSANNKVSYRNKRIHELKVNLTQKDDKLSRIVSDISNIVNEIASLNQMLTFKSEKLSELYAGRNARDKEIGELNKLLTDHENRFDKLDQLIIYHNQVLSSLSWRLTSPFRFFIDKLILQPLKFLRLFSRKLKQRNNKRDQEARSAFNVKTRESHKLSVDHASTSDEIAQLTINYNNVVSSLSWRLTSPIRHFIDHLIIRPLNFLRSLLK